MDVKNKIFLFSTILNLLDLLTSFIGFGMGYTETNHWMLVFHNKYISALMGVITFELILIGWYIFSMVCERAKYGMLAWGLTKLYPVINNLLLIIFSF